MLVRLLPPYPKPAITHKSFSGDSDLRIYSENFNKQTLINSLDMCAEKSSL